ncbi:MAG: hypothetical protein QXG09_08010, partial [Candidatus Bathyarchaeia archaeon]
SPLYTTTSLLAPIYLAKASISPRLLPPLLTLLAPGRHMASSRASLLTCTVSCLQVDTTTRHAIQYNKTQQTKYLYPDKPGHEKNINNNNQQKTRKPLGP